ncbi:MAG: type II secretion system F family protein [Ruminococcus sp.]|nr:type II secretion system F family protein [Ruminococcus sp.]
MLLTLMLICTVIGTVVMIFWAYLYFKYKKAYEGLLEEVEGKGYVLKDIYFVGLGCIEIYEKLTKKKITASKKAAAKMRNLGEVYGRENAELYYYVTVASQTSLFLTFFPFALFLFCMMKSYIGLLLGAMITFVMVNGVKSSIDAEVTNKKDAIINEFPKMVSKITLLINAGMLVRRAWDEVADSDHENPLYEEMRITSKDMEEGVSLEVAMDGFAQRCGIKEIRKFASMYVQAVNRGASETVDSMKVMSEEAWAKKRQYAKQRGELAAQKLLVPNMIMFMGILVVVVVPIFSSMFSSLKS